MIEQLIARSRELPFMETRPATTRIVFELLPCRVDFCGSGTLLEDEAAEVEEAESAIYELIRCPIDFFC